MLTETEPPSQTRTYIIICGVVCIRRVLLQTMVYLGCGGGIMRGGFVNETRDPHLLSRGVFQRGKMTGAIENSSSG